MDDVMYKNYLYNKEENILFNAKYFGSEFRFNFLKMKLCGQVRNYNYLREIRARSQAKQGIRKKIFYLKNDKTGVSKGLWLCSGEKWKYKYFITANKLRMVFN